MDNLDPKFIKSFVVEYHFEERQKFKVEVYDMDDSNPNVALSTAEYIGELEFMLHEVVTSKQQTLISPLTNSRNQRQHNGTIIIEGEEKHE
mmetsp:Transcript_3469/g.2470  ORF Transcript_3469/g.2470 Transcript_3469/m.2470 type:complete len:91 (-) Transcript_3469:2056-2328(-)|eukprot:CAMPEP_0202962074 /NCGR_PEP_ID=MMETSP1396-20130829/6172_1 /ASSEMBLY_ACC=CAM_ASM_000872 /TAXON_ID= /ORGANISM="Pseudokeronopsis sp., Strain Brazil" /LENGTH=90 /DNA_ID=CAMNT_0049682409 /DNA_START=306 /DNA_END=578 /DNA_ORIENTATION=-